MKYLDIFLDKITMYRLVLYYLIFLLFVSVIFSTLKILPYNPLSIIISTSLFLGISIITNYVFSKVFNAPTNVESVYITALILALIITPFRTIMDLPLIFFASVLAMSSKYILALNKKHIFNPVAIAVALTALGFGGSATWWIGTISLLPFTLLGLLIVRKIKRQDMMFYFFMGSIFTMLIFSLLQNHDPLNTLKQLLISSPIFFFAGVMLTEPLTTPPTKKLQSIYGLLVGVLFAPQFHIGTFYTTPETALILGNIFSYIVSPKYKLITTILQKIPLGPNMIDFLMPKDNISYVPGQYMEWTLPHENSDSRGNRRYFTVASSPTEPLLRLGVKFYPNGSSFKKALAASNTQTKIVGAQLSGDFILPKNASQKLVFIAGGIGITPFRSMLKYLIDTHATRPIIMFYLNKSSDEIVYADILTEAHNQLGIKTVYALTDVTKVPVGWTGRTGRINAQMISEEVPDYMDRIFYLSGPHEMVTAYAKILADMKIPDNHIKIDFFPGFA